MREYVKDFSENNMSTRKVLARLMVLFLKESEFLHTTFFFFERDGYYFDIDERSFAHTIPFMEAIEILKENGYKVKVVCESPKTIKISWGEK